MYDFGFSNGPTTFESNSTKLQINDARYHEVQHTHKLGKFSSNMLIESRCAETVGVDLFAQVSVIYHQSKKVILLVDKSHVKSMENTRTPLPFADIYIGGAPSGVLRFR